jgi:hypothetical protein
MAITIQEQVDFLWKRILYGVSKTAGSSAKFASNETVPSPLTVLPSSVWKKADSIPATPPLATTSIVTVLKGASAVQLTADPTSPPNVAWQACLTFNDLTTRLIDFIPPTFGVGYAVQVWIGNPVSGPAARIFPDTTGEEWVFDYAAGVLVFTGAIPANKTATVGAGPVSVATHGVYIQGYRYGGSKGVGLSADELPLIPSRLGQLVDVEDGTGTPTNGFVLTFKDGVWQAEPLPPSVTSFAALTDSPGAYAGHATYVVRVNAAGTGLEYAALPAAPFVPSRLGQLTDVEDGTGVPASGNVLTWKDGVWQAEPLPPSSDALGRLVDVNLGTLAPGDVLTYDNVSGKWKNGPATGAVSQLSDVTLTPLAAGDVLTYDSVAHKWENKPPVTGVNRFLDLLDTAGPYVGHQGYVVRVKATADGLEYFQLPASVSAFTQLSDAPHTYTGKGTYLVRVNGAENALEFVQAPFIPARIGQLLDVEDGTAKLQGQVLTWKDGVWQPELPAAGVSPGSLGDMAFQNHDSVDITGGTISGVTIDGGTF